MQISKQVTLVNLGGPRNADEVEAFLLDLLTDPLVVDMPLPNFLQKFIMTKAAKKRARHVVHKYKSLGFGGGSPLVAETERQASTLLAILKKKDPQTQWNVRTSMMCGFPNLNELSTTELTPSVNNIFIPLFPQFSRSTTMSFSHLLKKYTKSCPLKEIGCIAPFYEESSYIKSIAYLIVTSLQGKLKSEEFIKLDPTKINNWQNQTLLFSAHGIPMKLIKKGDMYQKQVIENADLITKELRTLGFKGEVHLSYQSRLGRGKWTTPSTIDKLKELGKQGCKSISIYPISFVSDHLETLEEIEIEFRDIAMSSGIETFHRIPAPGIWLSFIEFLAEQVLSVDTHQTIDCICLMGGAKSCK